MPADPPVPRNRDAERARNTARLWVGLAVLFTLLAVLRWLADDDLWSRLLYTAMAVAYGAKAWLVRRRAQEAAARSEAGMPGAEREALTAAVAPEPGPARTGAREAEHRPPCADVPGRREARVHGPGPLLLWAILGSNQ